jgi:glycosyltransferase involved in cell wall biosynthesis
MRVLHVDSAASWRGGQNQVLLAARGMRERGHEVAVACRAGGVLEGRARDAGVEVDALPLGGDLDPRAALALRRVVARRRPEVVQLHDPHAVAAGVLATLGMGAAAPRRVATRRVDFHVRGVLSRAKYRACEMVVAVSEAIAAVLREDGLSETRLRKVYEGVPDRAPQPGGRDALRALGLPGDALVIGNVAALTDHKDHATLLEAFARLAPGLPRAWLLIVGEGELRAELERRARESGAAGRVVFAGFRTDLDRLVPACDVFCLSSHMEGLGTSLLDAMCFARPVVVTAAGGMPEAVEDGVTGRVVPARDAAALAAALLGVLRDPGLAAAYGAAGRARFERRFTAARMVDESLQVYRELLDEARP